jgi:glycosyltransferase involved in cell wall biosynthesis
LAREHALMGHDVFVVTSDRYYPFPDYDNTVRSILGKRIIGTGYTKCEGFKIIRLLGAFEIGTKVFLKNLSPTIRQLKPELVICHGMCDFNVLIIILLKKRLMFKLICDDHGLFSEKKTGLVGFLFYNLFPFKLVLKYSDRLVGVSKQSVDFIVDLYKFPQELVEMIPLGADTELFRFNPKLRSVFRRAHAIDDDQVVITYTGKITYNKGPHNIITAVNRLPNDLVRKLVLLFVGNVQSEYKVTFESECSKIKNKVRIIRIPAVKNEELVAIYSASDLAIWPRQGSMSMIEAASCSRPIICCDFLTERYKNNNGIPVKQDDIDGLSKAIIKLTGNPALMEEMGRNGRELVEAELSWRVIAKRFLD